MGKTTADAPPRPKRTAEEAKAAFEEALAKARGEHLPPTKERVQPANELTGEEEAEALAFFE